MKWFAAITLLTVFLLFSSAYSDNETQINITNETMINDTQVNGTLGNESSNATANVTEIPKITVNKKWTFINEPGVNISFRTNHSEIDIIEIIVSLRNPVNRAEINVIRYLEWPDHIPEPGGFLYHYYEITQKNLDNMTQEDLMIEFHVNRTWVENERINLSSIVLSAYLNETWIDLTVSTSGGTNGFYTFTSKTPWFSFLVIRGEQLPSLEPPPECTDGRTRCDNVTVQQCIDGKWQDVQDCEKYCATGVCIEEIPTPNLWLIIIPVFVLAVYIIWRFRGKLMRERNLDSEKTYDKLKDNP